MFLKEELRQSSLYYIKIVLDYLDEAGLHFGWEEAVGNELANLGESFFVFGEDAVDDFGGGRLLAVMDETMSSRFNFFFFAAECQCKFFGVIRHHKFR